MLVKAIIRDIMDSKGVGVTKMAELLRFSTVQKVTDRLGTGKSTNMSTDKMDEMLRVLGYKAVIVPASVKLRDGWYEITDSNRSEIPEKRKPGRKSAEREE